MGVLQVRYEPVIIGAVRRAQKPMLLRSAHEIEVQAGCFDLLLPGRLLGLGQAGMAKGMVAHFMTVPQPGFYQSGIFLHFPAQDKKSGVSLIMIKQRQNLGGVRGRGAIVKVMATAGPSCSLVRMIPGCAPWTGRAYPAPTTSIAANAMQLHSWRYLPMFSDSSQSLDSLEPARGFEPRTC